MIIMCLSDSKPVNYMITLDERDTPLNVAFFHFMSVRNLIIFLTHCFWSFAYFLRGRSAVLRGALGVVNYPEENENMNVCRWFLFLTKTLQDTTDGEISADWRKSGLWVTSKRLRATAGSPRRYLRCTNIPTTSTSGSAAWWRSCYRARGPGRSSPAWSPSRWKLSVMATGEACVKNRFWFAWRDLVNLKSSLAKPPLFSLNPVLWNLRGNLNSIKQIVWLSIFQRCPCFSLFVGFGGRLTVCSPGNRGRSSWTAPCHGSSVTTVTSGKSLGMRSRSENTPRATSLVVVFPQLICRRGETRGAQVWEKRCPVSGEYPNCTRCSFSDAFTWESFIATLQA